jgi:SPP1 family predicted phage head-tail adaptor
VAKCSYLPATFKYRAIIQNVSRISDGQGGYSETWANVATVYCSVEPVKAYERFQAMQSAVPATHKIVMRYHPQVDATSRIVFRDRAFSAKEVIDQNYEGRFLTIKAIEIEAVELDGFAYLLLQGGGSLILQDGGRLLLGNSSSSTALLAGALDFSNPDNSAYLGAI